MVCPGPWQVPVWFPILFVPILGSPLLAAPVLNELAPRPRGGEGEWIELLNPDPAPLVLDGWGIRDATGVLHRLGPGPVLEPGGFVVLAARPESLRIAFTLAPAIPVWRPDGWPVLNDRDAGRDLPADVVVLVDAAGVPVDSVAYFEGWLPPEAGRSLERVDPAAAGTAPGNWGWSGDPRGGSPGTGNSLAGPDLVAGDWTGPGQVDPGRFPAVFHFRFPEPGQLAVSLLDSEGHLVVRLAEPHPVAAVGHWVWNPGTGAAPRPGPYRLCARWEGSRVLRRCRMVWVRR